MIYVCPMKMINFELILIRAQFLSLILALLSACDTEQNTSEDDRVKERLLSAQSSEQYNI